MTDLLPLFSRKRGEHDLLSRFFFEKLQVGSRVSNMSREKMKDGGLKHSRLYQIAGMTIQVESDHPFQEKTFQPKFRLFEVEKPGEDRIRISHYFKLPGKNEIEIGKEIYRKMPWVIYKSSKFWVYESMPPPSKEGYVHQIAVISHDYSHARIYHETDEIFLKGNCHSLTLFPTDQMYIAHLLSQRKGFYIHSGGLDFRGQGLLFVGHSDAGKSTMLTLCKPHGEILCDDRMIVRKWPHGFMIHGNWSHGEVPIVSSKSAPLKAVFFLEKSSKNRIVLIRDKRELLKRTLACVVKPYVTSEWWDGVLHVVEQLIQHIPCYRLHFDKSGRVVPLIEELCSITDPVDVIEEME